MELDIKTTDGHTYITMTGFNMTDSEKIDKLVVDVATLCANIAIIKNQIDQMANFESRLRLLEDYKETSKNRSNYLIGGILASIGTAIWNLIKTFS